MPVSFCSRIASSAVKKHAGKRGSRARLSEFIWDAVNGARVDMSCNLRYWAGLNKTEKELLKKVNHNNSFFLNLILRNSGSTPAPPSTTAAHERGERTPPRGGASWWRRHPPRQPARHRPRSAFSLNLNPQEGRGRLARSNHIPASQRLAA